MPGYEFDSQKIDIFRKSIQLHHKLDQLKTHKLQIKKNETYTKENNLEINYQAIENSTKTKLIGYNDSL